MNSNHKYQPTLKVTGISEYIQGKRDIENNTFIITPTGNFYLQEGLRIPEELFLKFHKVELQRNAIDKGTRLDSRSNWID